LYTNQFNGTAADASMRLLHYVVVFGKYDRRLERLGLLKVHHRKRHDDDDIAHLHFARGGTVQADAPTSTLALDHISVETLPVVVVDNLNFLAGNKIRRVHQVLINGDTANIIQVGLGHLHAMQLALQNLYLHLLLYINSEYDQ